MKRPTTKQITRVLDWLEQMDMRVYGPVIDDKTGEIWDESGYQDYTLKTLLLRWKALKREEKE